MSAGPVQATSLIVIGVVGVFVLIEKFMGPKRLVRVVSVPNPSWNWTRRDVESGCRLVGSTAGKVVVE